MEKVPYKLIINTDSYSGNFERELIAYSFGRLAKNTNGFTAFARPFWDSTVGTGVENYENYLKIEDFRDNVSFSDVESDRYKDMKRLYIESGMTEEEAINKINKLADKINAQLKEESLSRIYNEFLCFTMQNVDDWEEETFYNICYYLDNDNCSAIYVQLNKPLTKYFEDIIIPKIIKFFELDIYNRITDYEYLCQFDEINRKHDKPIVLKDLVLVDENDNIIKNYLPYNEE